MGDDNLILITQMNENSDINEILWKIKDTSNSLSPSISTFVMLEDAKKSAESIYIILAPPKFDAKIPRFRVSEDD